MPTISKFANANAVVTTGWTNPTNAYADDTSYATAAPGKNLTVNSDYGFADFTSAEIPNGAVIASVTMSIRVFCSVATANMTHGVQGMKSGSASGSEATQNPSAVGEVTVTATLSGITLADLRAASTVLKARARSSKGSTNTAYTSSLDWVNITVTWTTVEGSFTGDATIRQTKSGSFTGDATVMQGTRVYGSFSGDATIVPYPAQVRNAVGSNNGAGATTLTATVPTVVAGDNLLLAVTARGGVAATPNRGPKYARQRVQVSNDAALVYAKPGGSEIWAIEENRIVRVISTTTNTTIATIPWTGLTGVAASISGPGKQIGVFKADGSKFYLTTTGASGGVVYEFTTSSYTLTASIAVGNGSSYLCMKPDETRLYVLNTTDSTMSVINTSGMTIVTTITGFAASSTMLAILEDGTKVFVAGATYGGGVDVVLTSANTRSNIAKASYRWDGIAVNHASTRVYVGGGTGTVGGAMVINATTNAEVTTVTYSSSDLSGVGVSPDDTYWFLGLYGGSALRVYAQAANTLDYTITGLASFQSHYQAWTPDGSRMWVLDGTNLYIVDPASWTVVETIPRHQGTGGFSTSGAFVADTTYGPTGYVWWCSYFTYGTEINAIAGDPWLPLGAAVVSGTDLSQRVFWKKAGSSEPASYIVNLATSQAASAVMASVVGGSQLGVPVLSDGPTGTWISNAQGTTAFAAVTYVDTSGYWVAVGAGGALRHATGRPTGAWTSNPQGSNNFNDVMFTPGGGIVGDWVAVGANKTLYYKLYPDPSGAWTAWSPPGGAGATDLRSVAYGNGWWAAVGSMGLVYNQTHPDDAWTLDGAYPTTVGNGIAYGSGNWVGVGDSGGLYYKNSGNISTGSWVSNAQGSTTFNDVLWAATVAHPSGIWVAVGDSGVVRTAVNPSGAWTLNTQGTDAIQSVCYDSASGLWLATTAVDILYAADPTGVWTAQSQSLNGLRDVRGGDGFVVAVGDTGAVYYAPDGYSTDTISSTQYGGQANASSANVVAPAIGSWASAAGLSLFFGGSAYNTTPAAPSGYTEKASSSGGTGSSGDTTEVAGNHIEPAVTSLSALTAAWSNAAINIGHSVFIIQTIQPEAPPASGEAPMPFVGGGYYP